MEQSSWRSPMSRPITLRALRLLKNRSLKRFSRPRKNSTYRYNNLLCVKQPTNLICKLFALPRGTKELSHFTLTRHWKYPGSRVLAKQERILEEPRSCCRPLRRFIGLAPWLSQEQKSLIRRCKRSKRLFNVTPIRHWFDTSLPTS